MPNPISFTQWHYQNPLAGHTGGFSSDTSPYSLYQQFLGGQAASRQPGPSPGYTPNPPSQPGQPNPFGSVPGVVGLPNRFADLGTVFPHLAATNQQISSLISNNLGGQVTVPDLNYLQDRNAEYAQRMGMPGTNVMAGTLEGNRSARNLGWMQHQLQSEGAQQYASLIPTISGTQTTSPETQIGLADRNAYYGSAPNPTAANTYAQNRYDQYRRQMYGQGGGYQRPGPQEGTGSYSPPTPTPGPQPVTPVTPQQGNLGHVDNWSSFTPDQQLQYNNMLARNPWSPVYGLPDYMNPWSGDTNPNDAAQQNPVQPNAPFDWAPIGPPGPGLDDWDAAHPGAIPPGMVPPGPVNTVPKDWSDIQNIYMLMGYPMPNAPDNYGELDVDQYNNALYDAAGYNPYSYE